MRGFASAALFLLAAAPSAAATPFQSTPAPAIAEPSSGGTTVAEFLERWPKVEQLKEMATVSGEGRKLITAMGSPLTAYKAVLDADARAGKPPRACPVKGSTVKITSKDLLAEFSAIPPQRRDMLLRDAIFAMLDKRFPCPAPAAAK
jgi:hypothetical protein